jgi:phosphoribosylamine--glycine ligase
MKILVIGSGGREHAIADILAQSGGTTKLFAAPGNGGIREVASLVPIAADDIQALLKFAQEQHIDLTFVGPELPLSKGIVDTFRQNGLAIIGPTADDARLESSKSFAKNLFRANGIPTADYQECLNPRDAYALLETAHYPIVIKADGLAAGKGVTIAASHDEAQKTVRSLMEDETLGDAGTKVVIEEFLEGEEASFHVFADGPQFQPMIVAQDHKRRFDGDRGPNTGGMGAYSIDAILSDAQRQAVVDTIIRPTLNAVKSYSGILYAGLMLTSRGPKIIEYNVRFGDPETQVILPRLKTDLLDILVAIAEHRLAKQTLAWRPEATASITLAADTYPGKVESGKRISGLEEAKRVDNVKVYHAGTRYQDGHYYTAGGRVLNVTARGNTLAQALNRAYAVAEMITFDGKDYRKDIGQRGLVKEQ